MPKRKIFTKSRRSKRSNRSNRSNRSSRSNRAISKMLRQKGGWDVRNIPNQKLQTELVNYLRTVIENDDLTIMRKKFKNGIFNMIAYLKKKTEAEAIGEKLAKSLMIKGAKKILKNTI